MTNTHRPNRLGTSRDSRRGSIASARLALLTSAAIVTAVFYSLRLVGASAAVRGFDAESALTHARGPFRPWRYIVVHHSATPCGNAVIFDRYHRKVRGWRYGLGYHFVIGNGRGSADGSIQVGPRWQRQLAGAHVNDVKLNEEAIGMCLVGDFHHGGAPTAKQMESLTKLVRFLQERFKIPLERVLLHRDIMPGHTECPGQNFPEPAFYSQLRR